MNQVIRLLLFDKNWAGSTFDLVKFFYKQIIKDIVLDSSENEKLKISSFKTERVNCEKV